MSGVADRAALLDVFLSEAWETLWTLAAGERHLAGRGTVPRLSDDLPIVAHRLKGSAALYGFPALSELAGLVETLLGRVRVAPPLERQRAAEVLGGFVEVLKATLKSIEAGGGEDRELMAAFRARHAAVLAPEGPAAAQVIDELERFFAANGDILTYFVSEVSEHLDVISGALHALEQPDAPPDGLLVLLRALHTLKGAAYTVGCAPIGDRAHRVEDVLAELRDRGQPPGGDVLMRIAADVEALRGMIARDAASRERLPALLERGAAPAPGSSGARESREPEAPSSGSLARAEEPAQLCPTVRVPVACLDALVDLVGEFVVARRRLERHVEQIDRVDGLLAASAARMSRVVSRFELAHECTPVGTPPARSGPDVETAAPRGGSIASLFAELEFDRYSDLDVLTRSVHEIAADLSEIRGQLRAALDGVQDDLFGGQRLVGSLRTEVTRARLVPVGRLFARAPRQVRETAQATGKAVGLQVSGTTVEVDSAIIEQLADPLLHLVQNAVVHGLETADERRAAGKPAEGTIHLRAHHESGAVHVEVEDDGRGIDVEAVKARAIERGLITDEAASLLAEPEALSLVFLPGLSTAPEVTAVSGRGIGLDVARANVLRLNGDIEVSTRAGAGTRFSIRIPLTVLISDTLLVGAGGEVFGVPLSAVRLIQNVPAERIQAAGGREMVWVRDELMDLWRLDRCLDLPPAEAGREVLLLVLRASGRAFALAVDAIHGKEQCVIKALGGFPEGLGPFSSGTISSDGRVILVLNPTRLLRTAEGGASPRPSRGPGLHGAERPGRLDGRRRFLLVDDSISVRKFVGQMLENAGFDVVTASDGAAALEAMETTAIHAVVTDLEMPNVNGYELIDELRRRPSTRDLPIVILTTRGGEKHQDLARRLGVTHYLTKPVEEQAFVELMSSLVPPAESDDGRR